MLATSPSLRLEAALKPELADELITCGLMPGRTTEIRLRRLARPDMQALAKKQCDLWAFVWTCTSVLADVAAHVVSACTPDGTATTAGATARIQAIELGAGSGVASLASVKFGANCVATDLVQDALDLIHANGISSGLSVYRPDEPISGSNSAGLLRTEMLDWNKDQQLEALCSTLTTSQPSEGFRIVMGADILFSSWTVKPLLKVIARLLVPPTPALAFTHPIQMACAGYCIIVDPGRTNRDDFEAYAPDFGLCVLRRVDLQHMRTPIALMRECTLFLVSRSEDAAIPSSAEALPSPATTGDSATTDAHAEQISASKAACVPDSSSSMRGRAVNAFDDACRLLRDRCLTVAAVKELKLSYGYTLPVVK